MSTIGGCPYFLENTINKMGQPTNSSDQREYFVGDPRARRGRGLATIPPALVRTLTFDNGKEFACFKKLEQRLSAQVYFAHPYSAWERGTNENTNGLLRQYVPKETDITTVKPATLNAIVERLNNRPRKTLNYRTPREVLLEAIVALDG